MDCSDILYTVSMSLTSIIAFKGFGLYFIHKFLLALSVKIRYIDGVIASVMKRIVFVFNIAYFELMKPEFTGITHKQQPPRVQAQTPEETLH